MRTNRLRHKQDDTTNDKDPWWFYRRMYIQLVLHIACLILLNLLFFRLCLGLSLSIIDFKKLPKLTQERLMERLLDLFYTWLRTFKNLLLLKCIVLVKFRSFYWILTTFKHKFQSTQPNPNHLRIVTMCTLPKLQRLSLQSIKRSSNTMPETRRHHTNSVKLTKILWNDLITYYAMEHLIAVSYCEICPWHVGVQKQPFCVALIGE